MARASAYYPGLDGLRGVAVVMVLLFHSGLGWLSGGFLGVSVFFTLSGYLITALLLAEVEEHHRIDFRTFWGRRLRRLLPASLVVIAAVVIVAPLFASAVEESRIRGDAVFGVLYLSNWRYVQAGMSYEELFASMSPLLHLWSLSIEAQMYLVVPLVVIAGSALGLRRRGLALVFAGGVVGSALVSIVLLDGDRLYYGTDARAAELLIGSLVASLERESWFRRVLSSASKYVRSVIPLGALLAVIVIARMTTAGSQWVYSGGLVAFSLLSAVLVIGAMQPGPLRAVLVWRPLVLTGRVSYGLYLFHWPVFVWLTSDRMNIDGVALFGVQMLVTVAVTGLSYVFLETPIRRRRVLTTSQSTRAAVGVGVLGVLLLPLVFLSPYRTRVQSDQEILTTVAPSRTTLALGSESRTLRIVVLGDSTAKNWARALADVADPNVGVVSAGVIGCPLIPASRVYDRPGASRDASYCPDTIEIIEQYRNQVDVVVIVAGVANQWDFERRDLPGIVKVGSAEYSQVFQQWMDDVHEVLSDVGIPIVIFDAPITRQSDTVLGDEPDAVAAWNAVIAALDEGFVSVGRLPMSQFLSDPDSERGRTERPDGVHLDRAFAADLAGERIIPLLRELYDAIIVAMDDAECRIPHSLDDGRSTLDIERCRSGIR